MLKKQNILDLLKGDFTPLTESIAEKAESAVADIVVDLSEALLAEMTPGHKAMMKQHLDNVDVEDDTDEATGEPTKPKKRKDARIKNIKRPDDRDAYNQLNDFQASKSGKNTNFVGKTYTTNERALRSESIDEGMGKDIALATNWYGSGVDSYEKAQERKKARKDKLKAFFTGKKKKEVKEEVEPLEELSKATLGSYIVKAHASAKDAGDNSGSFEREAKKRNAVGQYGEGEKMMKQSKAWRNRELQRDGGIRRAVSKLTKEEVEPLEELSKATLGSYVKKASHDVATKSAAVGRYSERSQKNLAKYKSDEGSVEDRNNAYRSASKEDAMADRIFNKSWKRRQGMAKAVDKLTKD